MNPIEKNISRCFLTLFCISLFHNASFSQVQGSMFSKQSGEISLMKEDIQKKASAILHIAKNIKDKNFSDQASDIIFVKVINNMCGVYESQFDTNLAIFESRINDEFELIEEEDDWYQIKLSDGRFAWIARSCVQQIVRNRESKTSRFKALDNRNDQLQLASYLLDEVRLLVEVSLRDISKRLAYKRITADEAKFLNESAKNIRQYLALAESAFLLYIIPEDDKVTFADFLSKVSFLAELQLGASDFTMVRNENNQISQKGVVGEFLLDLAYQLNDRSAINLVLSSTNDIIQTPYSVTVVDLNYKSTVKTLNWNAGLSNTTYSDALNPFNNYNRLGLRLSGRHRLSKSTSYGLNYNLIANRYREFESIDFTNHLINFGSRTIINSSKSLSLELRANVQAGEESRRNFYLLNPGIRYDVKTNSSNTQYFANYQRYKFSNLALRDADRLMAGIRRNSQLKNRSRSIYLAMSSKIFSSRPKFSYYQFDSRFSTRWNRDKNVFTNSGIRINYFPQNTNQNFADIQFSFGNSSALFYTFSTFNRLYYQLQPLTSISDINIISGLNFKGFKIGPSLSLHALVNVEDFSFEKDGNFYRLGGYVEGSINFPYQINLLLSAAYDYGFVYSQQFEQDSSTGELDFGEVNVRHPATFQLNTLLSTSIIRNTDIFMRLSTYIIDTDITSVISRDPFESNSRFLLRLGVKYRFN